MQPLEPLLNFTRLRQADRSVITGQKDNGRMRPLSDVHNPEGR
jgi:hypothetical protein